MSLKSYARWMLSRRIVASNGTAARRAQARSRMLVEQLEDRSVPAIISITPNPTGLIPLEGVPSGTVTPIGTFTVDNFIGQDQSSQLSAEIEWGDGIVSGGLAGPTVVFSQNQGAGRATYNVFASHIYTVASTPSNPYTLTLRIFDNTGPGTTQSASSFLTVRDNPLTAQANPTVNATVGAPLNNVIVARFTDANPFTQPDQLRATITWANPARSAPGIIVRDFNGVYSVIGSHTYDATAAAGPSPITVNIVSQDPAFGITINNQATVNQAAIVPIAAPIGLVEGTTTIPAGTVIGTFTDQGGAQPVANYSGAATFALFPGATGLTPLTVTRNGTTNTYSLTSAAPTTFVAPARIGVISYNLQVTDTNGNVGRSTGTVTVNNAPLTFISTANVPAPTEGQPITLNPLFTFSDANTTTTAADYTARINWGDGTPDTVGTITALGGGQFQVSGTHTYTRRTGANTQRITISVTDSGNQTLTATTNNFIVADALLSNGTGLPVVGAAGQQLVNVPVATFVDANPFAVASDYTASINWGNGTSTGFVTLVGRSAAGTVFSITGTNVYNSVAGSPFPVQTTLTDIGGQTLLINTTATITQSSLEVSVFSQNGSAGLPLVPSAPLALFTDSNGAAAVGSYTARVNWGDGSPAVTFAPGQGIALVSGNQLSFTAPAGHTYARPGLYPITVTILGPDGRTGVGAASALLAAPAFSGVAGAANITTAVEGAPLPPTTPVAVFTVANPAATPGEFTAMIDWGDGSPMSMGIITATGTTATTASFQVAGGHTYTRYNAGPLTIRVAISDAYGTTVNAATSVTVVADAALGTPVPVPVVGAAGQQLVNVPIGTFVDANPFATAADHTVVINWGDGNPPTSGVVTLVGRSGTGTLFAVTGSRVYTTVTGSPFAVSAVVTDAGGSNVTINTTATITQSPLAVTVFSQNGSAGLPLVPSAPLALFTDSNGARPVGSYTARVNWGDGSPAVTFAPGQGIALVSGNQFSFTAPAGHTYARPGLYPVTVTILGPDGRTGVGSASAVLAIPAFSGVAGAANITTAVEGAPLPATTPVAVFTVANPAATPGEFTAMIDWGDGSPMSMGIITATGTTATTASFQVAGGHTYTRYNAGPLTIRVAISDAYGTTVNAATSVTVVADAALGTPVPVPVVGAAGQQLVNVPIGTFVDANPFATAADHTVVINWGDGNPPTSGVVTLVGRSGTGTLFAVTGSRVYTTVTGSPFAVSAVVTDAGGSNVTINTTATITQSPLAVDVNSQAGAVGAPLTLSTPLALFTDSNGARPVASYTATINWGDGSAPVTLLPGQGIGLISGNQLSFSSPVSRTYARPGLYPITITIAGPDGRTGIGTGFAQVAPAPFVGGIVAGANINTVEGTAVPPATVLATFTVANPAAVATDFTANLDWGDGSPQRIGTITRTATTATTATFQVTGGHTFTRPGTYPITVRVADAFGGGGVATVTATITNAPLINPQGVAATGTARQPLSDISLGVFTDTNRFGSANEYTAVINWNDPQAPGADPIGRITEVGGSPQGVVFGINGSHTYSRAGTYAVSIVVTDTSGQTITINTNVVILPPPLTGTVNPVVAIEGQPTIPNLPIATFFSPGGTNPADYTATVNWGDGVTDKSVGGGVTISAAGGGNFTVLAPTHTYATRGSYVITVTIAGIDGSGPISPTNLATVKDAPLTGVPGVATASEGIPFVATSTNPLVTFTDANPNGKASEFLATIDWGDGTSGTGTIVQTGGAGKPFQVLASHTYPDNLGYTATVVISSSGGQRAVIPAVFTVSNVAPTALITNTGPVDENTPVTVSLLNAFDPSPADTAAGLRYSFALTPAGLANSYLAAGLSNSAQFTFPDGPSTQVVWGRVLDKDGGFTDYQTTVVVRNVAPTATIAATGALIPRQPITITMSNPSDPSPVDTAAGFTYSFDFGNGVFTAPSKSPTAKFTPSVSGTLTVRGRIIDKDGGFSEYTVGGANGLVVRDLTVYAVGAGAGGAPLVNVYSPNGNFITGFFAYDPSFRGGVNVAVGDVTGDGIPDIVTGTGSGGGPHVKVFDGRDYSQVATFMATNPEFRGGIHVAVGDIDGDGIGDVVTGAGDGGGPRVQVFRGGSDYPQIRNFFAYDSSFRGGVNIAAGDVDGDGFAEIIAGAGLGGAPHVKIFDGRTSVEFRSFFAYEDTFRGGVNVAVGDINRDGRVEIVTGPGLGGGSRLRSFDALSLDEGLSVFAFGPDRVNGKPLRNGMTVAVTGLTSARGPVVIVGSGPDYASLVTIRDGRTFDELNTIVPFERDFSGGVFVG